MINTVATAYNINAIAVGDVIINHGKDVMTYIQPRVHVEPLTRGTDWLWMEHKITKVILGHIGRAYGRCR